MAKYDTEKLQNFALYHGVKFWNSALKFYGSRIGKRPEIKMNSRLTSTAGRAWLEDGFIDLSCYLLTRNPEEFANVIIPHELCHMIAWRLYRDKGHGHAWKTVMVEMGLKPETYHELETLSMAKKKANSVPR